MQSQNSPKIGQSRQYAEHELVFMLGEELKKPLTAIKLLAENNSNQTSISLEARKALRTVDNVLLYQQLDSQQLTLDFTTVHVGSTLTQVAAELQPLSIEHGCETEVHIQSGVNPVDVDRQVLRSGLESLWQAMLGMTARPSPLNWHVYRTPQGIRIALTNNSVDLSKVSFAKITDSAGSSRQPYAGVAGAATDLVTARGMFALLGSSLSKITKEGQQGLAVTLPISAQLALV